MWLRISDKYNFAFVKAPLYKMRIHTDRLTSNLKVQLDGLKKLHQKHSFRIESAPRDTKRDIFFQYYCQLSKILILHSSKHTNEARRQSIEAIKLKPFSFGGYEWFVVSLIDRRAVRALSSLFNWGTMRTETTALSVLL